MKKLVVIIVMFLCYSSSFAQFGIVKKKQNEVSTEDILKRVKESEEKRAYKPEQIIPFYSPQQREVILKQIRNAKKIEDLPVITTIAHYSLIEAIKLVTVTNGITDEKEVKWNSDEKLKIGDTIRVYGTYNLGQYMPDHVPSINDLSPVPYKNRLARITPNHDDKSRFISTGAVEKCLNYWGDKGIWYAYEGRKDTILLREQYLKEKQQVK